jgi:short-subunit dehydrogenase
MSGRPGAAAALARRVHHALIVGASGGIGRLVVDALAVQSIALSTVGRRPSAHAGAFHFSAAALEAVDWSAVYADAEERAAVPLDAIVYVAGDAVFGKAGKVPEGRARALFDANFWAPCAAAVAAQAHWAALRRRATFVSVSSISARRAVPFEAHYCASKAACARFLEALTLEHPDERIRFVSLYPGRLRTAFRAKAEWYGLPPDPAPTEGNDPIHVVRAILSVLGGGAGGAVIGSRERAIDAADRIDPRLYDRLVLARRVRKALDKA